ncbi:p058 [Rhizobium phage 16-3]|uniref:p058 n=1 Tax=Rhizobium phage 16-3 TaxID=10704 RepID=UPI00017BA60B|nr:p058 [Rhizobium phage 16-3]ABF71311.1 p058 [Rhizobium phage 16-3]
MSDIVSKEVQEAYWDEWQQTRDHWLALSAALKAQCAEPVAVVQREQDYWSRGHFYKGSKNVVVPLNQEFYSLPIGTKLGAVR